MAHLVERHYRLRGSLQLKRAGGSSCARRSTEAQRPALQRVRDGQLLFPIVMPHIETAAPQVEVISIYAKDADSQSCM